VGRRRGRSPTLGHV